MSNTRRKVFLSPATNEESFILLDETLVKVSGLNHAEANSSIETLYLFERRGIFMYLFLFMYLFIY